MDLAMFRQKKGKKKKNSQISEILQWAPGQMWEYNIHTIYREAEKHKRSCGARWWLYVIQCHHFCFLSKNKKKERKSRLVFFYFFTALPPLNRLLYDYTHERLIVVPPPGLGCWKYKTYFFFVRGHPNRDTPIWRGRKKHGLW